MSVEFIQTGEHIGGPQHEFLDTGSHQYRKTLNEVNQNYTKDHQQRKNFDIQDNPVGKLMEMIWVQKKRTEKEKKYQRVLLFQIEKQRIEMQYLKQKLEFSQNMRDLSWTKHEWLGSPFVKPGLTEHYESVDHLGSSLIKDSISNARVFDEDWSTRMMSGWIHNPKDSKLGPTSVTCNNYTKIMPPTVNYYNRKSLMDKLEFSNLYDIKQGRGAVLPSYNMAQSEKTVNGPPSINLDNEVMHENFSLKLLKTEMCHGWMHKGVCPHGKSCRFAHGSHELRQKPRHWRYRTELCKNFIAGDCSYGSHCCFVHNLADAKIDGNNVHSAAKTHSDKNREMVNRWQSKPTHPRIRR